MAISRSGVAWGLDFLLPGPDRRLRWNLGAAPLDGAMNERLRL